MHAEDAPAPIAPQPRENTAPRKRVLILHYHLFKNAGTSIDEILKYNFGAQWENAEFKIQPRISNANEVQAYLANRPQLAAFSSHTALLPLPRLADVHVFPVLFLRHPLARLRSAYAFERHQNADTEGAKLAKVHDFAGYLRALLANKNHRQVRNFQTNRLAFNAPAGSGTEFERAMRAILAMPFVGLVEAFDASIRRLEVLLSPLLPAFKTISVRKNVTSTGEKASEYGLTTLREQIGDELYVQLLRENTDDVALFDLVRQSYCDI